MKSILVIEDEERISAFISKGLTAAGFSPQIAADGFTGRDLALTGDFTLVILDIGLPGLDGFSVLGQLRERRPELPVLVLTARDNPDDTIYALESGAVDYMIKPFRFAELLARVRLRLKESPQGQEVTELIRDDVRIDPHLPFEQVDADQSVFVPVAAPFRPSCLSKPPISGTATF